MAEVISSVHWRSASLALLAALLLTAVYTDVRERRIPNALVLTALMTGLVLNLLPTDSLARGGLFAAQPGALGGWRSLVGAIAALLLLLPFWLLSTLGAGDVKLLAAVGAFVGAHAIVQIVLFVLLAGGVVALARLVLHPSGRQVWQHLQAVFSAAHRPKVGPDVEMQTAWRMPYALAIALGVLAYSLWTLNGYPPILKW